MRIVPNRSLAPYTTLGIGGTARYFTEVTTAEEMQEAIGKGLPFLILGKGSNCLLGDFDGLVILNKIAFCQQEGTTWHVGAGCSFSLLGVRTARAGYTGLEFASGIPGSVGGAVVMNAGANGQETADRLQSVDIVDRTGQKTLSREELTFGYRSSPFQHSDVAVVSATFALESSDGARKSQIDLLMARKETQPLSERSAGCMFRNPPNVSAGKLIEEAGLKGLSVGGAEISSKHANFIVNKGGATADDVRELISQVKRRIEKKWGITLQEEVIDVSR